MNLPPHGTCWNCVMSTPEERANGPRMLVCRFDYGKARDIGTAEETRKENTVPE